LTVDVCAVCTWSLGYGTSSVTYVSSVLYPLGSGSLNARTTDSSSWSTGMSVYDTVRVYVFST